MADRQSALVSVVRAEPADRLRRLLEACARQTVACDVYVAAPRADHPAIATAASDVGIVVHHIENPSGGRSAGLNLAVRAAANDIVCRIDARTRPPDDYVERCLRALRDPSIGLVGGVQRPVAIGQGLIERGVARALGNPWAVGAPAYRLGARSGPVDTVYLGAFRRRQMLDVGGYDERLDANEDFELASRYRAAGYLVFLDAEIVHDYEVRSTFGEVLAQYRAFGRSKVRYWSRSLEPPNARQAIALVGVPAVAALAVASRHRVPLAGLGVLAVAAVDHLASPADRDLRVRAAAVAVEIAVPLAWVGGILEESWRLSLERLRGEASEPGEGPQRR